jgi:cysteine desulfurase
VNAHPSQVIFTSGGTEANNLFVKGVAACLAPAGVAVGATEHPSVAAPARALSRQGWQVRQIAVDGDGRLATAALENALEARPAFVSVMLANNETGTLQDVAALAEAAHAAGALVHSDAVQALGKVKVDFAALGVDALTISAHKIYGPKGVGALVVERKMELAPLLDGGGHERGLRSGSENVPAIVGFGAACERAGERLARGLQDTVRLRDALEAGLRALGAVIFGANAPRLGNTSFFAIPGIEGETLVMALDRAGFALASGAACSSHGNATSPVLAAMGVARDLARGAVRVSLGEGNDETAVRDFLAALADTVKRLTALMAPAV